MATKKEVALLLKLQTEVSKDTTTLNEYGRPAFQDHPKQEYDTYLDGVADCIRLLTKQKTLDQILNS